MKPQGFILGLLYCSNYLQSILTHLWLFVEPNNQWRYTHKNSRQQNAENNVYPKKITHLLMGNSLFLYNRITKANILESFNEDR